MILYYYLGIRQFYNCNQIRKLQGIWIKLDDSYHFDLVIIVGLLIVIGFLVLGFSSFYIKNVISLVNEFVAIFGLQMSLQRVVCSWSLDCLAGLLYFMGRFAILVMGIFRLEADLYLLMVYSFHALMWPFVNKFTCFNFFYLKKRIKKSIQSSHIMRLQSRINHPKLWGIFYAQYLFCKIQ